MTRIAHLADPHLGVRHYARSLPNGINAREADVARAFAAAIDGIIAARPDAVLVAGDLFHSVRPSNAAVVFAFEQFARLRQELPEAPVVLIGGNHDTPHSSEGGNILRLFTSASVDVVSFEARRLCYPSLDLAVLAVPHPALVSPARPSLLPDGPERYQVLCLHGEVEGVFPADRGAVEYGGALVAPAELETGWSYVALGHYHVQHEVAPRCWYAGALDYISSNLWGELSDEARLGVCGKGWLLADLAAGTVERQGIAPTRPIHDLDPIQAGDLTADELTAEIAAAVHGVPGGIEDAIVRLRVFDVPREVARQLDHAAIRHWKAEALHFHLDLRKPTSTAIESLARIDSGRRKPVPEMVLEYLGRRDLPPGMDRSEFVRIGAELMTDDYAE